MKLHQTAAQMEKAEDELNEELDRETIEKGSAAGTVATAGFGLVSLFLRDAALTIAETAFDFLQRFP